MQLKELRERQPLVPLVAGNTPSAEPSLNFRRQVVVIEAHDFGSAGQILLNPFVKAFSQEGKELVSNPVSEIAIMGIGTVTGE